jgi:hypothetical protein
MASTANFTKVELHLPLYKLSQRCDMIRRCRVSIKLPGQLRTCQRTPVVGHRLWRDNLRLPESIAKVRDFPDKAAFLLANEQW